MEKLLKAYEGLIAIIDYAMSKNLDTLPPIIRTDELMNRLKPYVEMMKFELEGKIEKNNLYAHVGMEECNSCGHKHHYGWKPYCDGCGKKNIMNPGGKIDYNLLNN